MASLNISMPEKLRDFVMERTKQTQHATPTEYIRSLVRDDQKRAEQERLERMLLDGLESGEPIDVDDVQKHFSAKKEELLARLKARPKARRR